MRNRRGERNNNEMINRVKRGQGSQHDDMKAHGGLSNRPCAHSKRKHQQWKTKKSLARNPERIH